MKPVTIVCACFAVLASLSGLAQAGDIQVLDQVRVFDGSGSPALDNARVVIQGGKVSAVGPSDQVAVPQGAQIFSLPGKTVIPGLISDHSHIGQYDATTTGTPYNEQSISRQLQQYSAYGVTTVVALGMNKASFYPLRDKVRKGLIPGADLFGSDRGIGVPKGAPPIKAEADQLDRPETPDQARQAVRDAAARGTDLIKLWLDDFQGAKLVTMQPRIYAAVIEEAHRLNLRVVAHVYYQKDAKALMKLGLDVIGHGIRDTRIDDEFIELMRAHGTWYIPTLTVDEAFYRFAESPELLKRDEIRRALNPSLLAQFESPQWQEQQLKNLFRHLWHMGLENNQINTKKLFDAGVNVGFGTDSGAMPLRIPGYAEHRELELLVEAGLSPAQALTLATGKAAAALKLDDRGLIMPGKRADLVVVEGDPTESLMALGKIVKVFHQGRPTTRQAEPF